MVAYAIGITLKSTLQNHIFTFNGRLYKQTKGGAIGVGIAGDVANLFMVWWDRKMKFKCINHGIFIKSYSRYVDDTNIVLKSVDTGDDEKKEEKTMMILKEIANTIHPSIEVTVDYPSNHENGRMPILDTEQWIENIKVGDSIKPQILHSHYSKPMASKYVTHRNSAIPYINKINILVAELMRIMRNISIRCKDQERIFKIQEYLLRLQHSGYNKKERHIIYIKAKRKYEIIKEKVVNGTCPLYRSKFWNQGERRKEKLNKIKTWFNYNNKFDTIFFVDYTHNSMLAKECQKAITDVGLKIKVVEKTGRSLKEELVKSNPFEKKKCNEECFICDNYPKINCKMREVMYNIKCNGKHNNEIIYDYGGETCRSIAERFGEHINDINEKKRGSTLYSHFIEEHNGETQPINLEIVKQCCSNAMLRQATEAVFIRENKPILNARRELGLH